MNSKNKELYVFGYGLALLIPFLVTWHGMHVGLRLSTIAVFIAIFASILTVTARIAELIPVRNLWIFVFHFAAFLWEGFHGLRAIPAILLCLSTAICFITIINVSVIEPLYRSWMRVAHLIGTIVTNGILTVLFYIVFGTAGLILRMMGKDLLDRSWDQQAATYWQARVEENFDLKHYTRQY